jgi:predicted aconitase
VIRVRRRIDDGGATVLLKDEETAMLAGQLGAVPKLALTHQIKVGEFFGAQDFVAVTQAHVMADTESLGDGQTALAGRN